MHKRKRKFNQSRLIGIIGLIISVGVIFGSLLGLVLENFQPWIAMVTLFIGGLGTMVSRYLIIR